jgi:hypothetical protein
MADDITIDLRGCARCHGEGHPRITFRPLTFPVRRDETTVYTHWAACPTNGEPIMMLRSPSHDRALVR